MSVTSGFFNSLNGDRKYNAEQLSGLFDGLINDGVFEGIGKTFAVTSNSGLDILVAPGKAWFNNTWILNDSILPLTLTASEMVQDRIDAVVITIDKNDSVRDATISVITGTPAASDPSKPTMSSSNDIYQHPLAYIYRKANSTEVTQSNITNAVGTSDCPYVTGIVQVNSIDIFVAQWQAQFEEWINGLTNILDDDAATKMAAHIQNKSNPHEVTLSQLGIEYGDALPSTGTAGQIFFLKS